MPAELAEGFSVQAIRPLTAAGHGLADYKHASAEARKLGGEVADLGQIEGFIGHEDRLQRLLLELEEGGVVGA